MADSFTPFDTPPQDSFTPLDREAELAAQAGPRGYTFSGQVKKPGDEPGLLKQAYGLIGGTPGVGAVAGTYGASKMLPELEEGGNTGVLQKLLRGGIRAGGAAAGGGMGALIEGQQDPIPAATGAATGELIGGALAKPIGWAGSKIASRFGVDKYFSDIGAKLGEVFHMAPLKSPQEIYNALRTGDAEKSIVGAYRGAQDLIFKSVGPDTPITGDKAKFLNRLFYDNLPQYRSLVDSVAQNAAARGSGFVSKYSSFAKQDKMRQADMLNNAIEQMPITVENAMEYARQLSAAAIGSKQGAPGYAVRQAHREAKTAISGALDELQPGKGIGAIYDKMNKDYRNGIGVLSTFDDPSLFRETPSGPIPNRPAWQKVSNDAIKKLRELELGDLDEIIRMGRAPGAVGTMAVNRPHVWIPGVHGGMHLPISIENPLRPTGDQVRKIVQDALRGTGAFVGSQATE